MITFFKALGGFLAGAVLGIGSGAIIGIIFYGPRAWETLAFGLMGGFCGSAIGSVVGVVLGVRSDIRSGRNGRLSAVLGVFALLLVAWALFWVRSQLQPLRFYP